MKRRPFKIIGLVAAIALLLLVVVREQTQKNRNRTFISACAGGDIPSAAKLLRAGANINFQTSGTGFTALHWAVYEEEYAMAKFLLEQGADFRIKDVHGQTAEELLKSTSNPGSTEADLLRAAFLKQAGR